MGFTLGARRRILCRVGRPRLSSASSGTGSADRGRDGEAMGGLADDPSAPRIAAGVVLVVSVCAAAAGAAFGFWQLDHYAQTWGALLAVFLAFAVVGWTVATRHPANPVGWLLLGFGRASGEQQRAQLRWVAWASALMIGVVVVVVVRNVVGTVPAVLEWATMAGLAGVPVALGVAMLRYRLYDIDRLASRTGSGRTP